MSAAKRATIYLDQSLHKALKLKSAETDSSISDLVNEALKSFLLEDADDLSEIEKRKKEATMDFESFLQKLKKDGKI